MARKTRVAVVGASGIGRHHAKWHHVAGAEVVAFLGTNRDSCTQTAESLRALFGFAGEGVWEWDALLATRPDMVDICTPNETHSQYIGKALAAGCHVLCEKPLIWRRDASAQETVAQAQELVRLAASNGLKLGICTQYAAGLPQYERLYRAECGALDTASRFYAEMDTLDRGRSRSVRELWIDMGSHPLSLLLRQMPRGYIRAGSLKAVFADKQARVRFEFVEGDRVCACDIAVRDVTAGPPARRFGFNGYVVDCSGKNDENGVYRMALSRGDREALGQDYMSLLVEQFHRSVADPDLEPLVDGQVGVRNLELQLQILAAAG